MKEEIDLKMFESFIPLLKQMMSAKRPLSAAPTFTPQNAFEQWQIYENGATRRLYIHVNGTWRYTALT